MFLSETSLNKNHLNHFQNPYWPLLCPFSARDHGCGVGFCSAPLSCSIPTILSFCSLSRQLPPHCTLHIQNNSAGHVLVVLYIFQFEPSSGSGTTCYYTRFIQVGEGGGVMHDASCTRWHQEECCPSLHACFLDGMSLRWGSVRVLGSGRAAAAGICGGAVRSLSFAVYCAQYCDWKPPGNFHGSRPQNGTSSGKSHARIIQNTVAAL